MTIRVLDQVPTGTFFADESYSSSRPEWLQQKGIEIRTTDFPRQMMEKVFDKVGADTLSRLLQIPYTVLPPDWCSAALELPFFVGFVDHEGERYYFASEDLSQQYADLWILHEAIELTMYSGSSPGLLTDSHAPYSPCRQALMDELVVADLIGVNMKFYIMDRYKFFQRLVAFHQKHKFVSEDQLRGMQESYEAIHEEFEMLDFYEDD